MTTRWNNRALGGSLMIAGAAGISALMLGLSSTGALHASPDEHTLEQVRIGTYEPQRAFQMYEGAQAFSQELERLQQEMQQAQQQGDQQRVFELQQQMQRLQDEVVQRFYTEVEKVLPDLAERSGVQIVALEVVYTDPAIDEPMDLTAPLMEKVNKNFEHDAERPEPEPDPLPW